MSASLTAFVPGYEYDVFVSYAWVNNQIEPGTRQTSGWVSIFREGLRQGIDGELGRTDASRFFVDTEELEKNRGWGKQLESALNKTAVFVMVLSQGYISSQACRAEIAHFKKVIESASSDKIWDSGRLFVVHARPLPEDENDWPELFPKSRLNDYLGPNPTDNPLGYRFFVTKSGRRSPKQLKPTDLLYQDTLEELRVQIAKQLRAMKRQAKTVPILPTTNPNVGSKSEIKTIDKVNVPTLLLAKTTDDLQKVNKELSIWCASARIRVLPEKPWPSASLEFQAAVKAAIKQADIVVQVLSDLSAEVEQEFFPSGREKWQYDIAKEMGVSIFCLRDGNPDFVDMDVSEAYRELLRTADVWPKEKALFFDEIVMRTQRAFDVGVSTQPFYLNPEKRRAMVKFNRDDHCVNRMLNVLAENNVQCRTCRNGRPLLDRLREIPFDGLVIVLGECDDDWLEDRGDELIAVELGLKDQAPIRAYFHPDGTRRTPPLTDNCILQIYGEAELENFVKALRLRGTPL